jgi:two-component system, OmpR family, sensor histidine kinase MtrB
VLSPLVFTVSLWRRSILTRVVVSTLVLSALVVFLVGWVLLHQVTDGLLDSKRTAAVSEASAGIRDAQSFLDAAESTGQSDSQALLTQLVFNLGNRGGESRLFQIVVTGPISPFTHDTSSRSTITSPTIDPSSIPARLRATVERDAGVWWTYSRARFADSSEPSEPAIVAGSQIELPTRGGLYTLYYVFPLTEQHQTLVVVTRALVTAGALLVLLLGAIAFMVTRQVVTPVRLARRIAERLAAGRLEERMHVRGEDDIARLGMSFNQMAAGLQRQIRQLEELSRVQRRFVADVSHELRTPLTTVRMAADVLHEAREGFDGATARSAELLQNELDRFESLLTDLLEISRFDAGAAGLDLDHIDLRDVVHQVVEAATPIADAYGSRLLIRAPNHPCIAEADTRRIERIVRNLVSNAIEHGEGRDIVICVESGPDAAAVSVRDFGVGLKPGEAALVFNRFWRADPARARTSGGTGLGLSIASEDARLHGGWLQAWGEIGVGSVFRLTLPRRVGGVFDRSPLPLSPASAESAVGVPYARTDSPGRGLSRR